MKPQSVHILISGAKAPIALEMARSFKIFGCKVIMMDSLNLTIAKWSNHVDEYYVVPSPRFFTQAFVKEVCEIIQTENITHFIPTCEKAIFLSSRLNQFKCKVWTSPIELILKLHNKFEFTKYNSSKFARQLSFDVIIDKNQTPYFIECNPRGTSGAHLLNNNLVKAIEKKISLYKKTKPNYVSDETISVGKCIYSYQTGQIINNKKKQNLK